MEKQCMICETGVSRLKFQASVDDLVRHWRLKALLVAAGTTSGASTCAASAAHKVPRPVNNQFRIRKFEASATYMSMIAGSFIMAERSGMPPPPPPRPAPPRDPMRLFIMSGFDMSDWAICRIIGFCIREPRSG